MVCALIAPDPLYGPPFKRNMKILNDHPINKIESWIKGYNPREYGGIEFYVERTGGEVRVVSAENAASQFTELIDRLYDYYNFGYLPTNRKRDGKFRRIKLKVSPEVEQREGGVIIKTREGYYALRGDSTRDSVTKQPPPTPKQ